MYGRRFFLTDRARQLHVRVLGEGPPVVVIPDLPGTSAGTAEMVDELAVRYRAYVVDLPGIGASTRDEDATGTADAMGLRIGTWLDRLGLARTHLYGRGVGAVFALAAASGEPDRYASVILDELPLHDGAERSRRLDAERPLPAPTRDGAHLVHTFHRIRDHWLFDPWFDQDRVTRPVDMPDAMALHAATMDVLAGPDAFNRLRVAALEADVAGRLARMRMPVRTFALGAGDGVTATAETIDDLQGHRETVAAHTLAFLDELPPLPDAAVIRTDLVEGGITRRYVDTADGQIHLRLAGDPAGSCRPLVMLHSAPGSAEPLEAAMLGLARDRFVVAPDFPGNGDSDKPDRRPGTDIAALARTIAAALDSLPHDRFDLWGSHTGGLIAMELSIADPERFGAMILDAVPLLDPTETADILEHYLPRIVPDVHGTHLLDAWHMRRDMFLYWPWYRRLGRAVRPMLLPDVETFHSWTLGLLRSGTTYDLSYRAAFEYATAERLPRLSIPTLLSSGPTDMLADGLETARQLAPGIVEIEPTPATVWYPRQNPDAVVETIDVYREFLDRHA